jgi:hypothetical protein
MHTGSRGPRRIVSLSAVLIAAAAAAMSQPAAAAGPAPVAPGGSSVPPTVDVPLSVVQATLESGALAVRLSCASDGTVKAKFSSRRVAKSRFDCTDGAALARLPVPKNLSARVRGGRIRIDARASSVTVTRTMRPKVAAARLAWDTPLNINGGVSYNSLGCWGYARIRKTATGWADWFGTTGVCSWQKWAGEYAAGTVTQYSYLSVQGTWVLYRTAECPVGSSTCRWTYALAGF